MNENARSGSVGGTAPAGIAPGRFVTLEGIEGVGKTTQVKRLAAALEQRGISHGVTREPGGTPLAETIRDIVLKARAEALPDSAELLLMFAARAVHLANFIEPALRAGRWVICDRFTDATYAYQGGGRNMPLDGIRQLERLVQGARQPDLTLLLDAPVELGLERARVRNADATQDRFERERLDFFVRVRAAYLARAAAEPRRIVILDATQSIDHLTGQIIDALRGRAWIS